MFKSKSDEILDNLLEFRAYPQMRTFQVPIGKFREFNTILLFFVMCFIVFIIDKKTFQVQMFV